MAENNQNKLDFQPELNPKQMLDLGVFGGKYFDDIPKEFPYDWFKEARLSKSSPDPKFNYFEVLAGQPYEVWIKKGWINEADPLGWFQWYCRYYQGRRLGSEDNRQIKRWKAMKRHIAQVTKNCHTGDTTCRRKQRQALLQWAYDSRKL